MKDPKEKVKEILIDRDDLTEEEAEETITDTMAMVYEAIESGDFLEAEDIFMDELGLEPDYLLDLLI